MAPSCLLILVFAGCANALNFTSVLEWSYDSGFEVDPRYLAVYEENLFLSLFKHKGVQSTLTWLQINATSPKLQPFPSTVPSGTDSCNAVQSARGIEVDTIGRLWALDNGESTCPPRLWVFDLTNNNKIVQIHEFADEVVPNSSGKRWLLNLALDQSENGWLAYIVEYYGRHLVVFSFERNYSWRVKIENKPIGAVALSPMRMRQFLYISEWNSKNIFSLPVADLRAGAKNASLTLKSTSASSYWSTVMTMDDKGILYFILCTRFVFKWDTNSPFKEEQLYTAESEKNNLTSFTLDASGNFWVMESSLQKPELKLLKARVSQGSYLHNSVTTESTPREGSTRKGKKIVIGTTSGPPVNSGSVLVIALACTTIITLVTMTALIILCCHLINKRRSQRETEEMTIFRPESPLYDDVRPESDSLLASEERNEEIMHYDYVVTSGPSSPVLYEEPYSSGFGSHTSSEGPNLENSYENVAPEFSEPALYLQAKLKYYSDDS
ncbi:Hypothetical predicted protein [Cloeon dipterum]|uniref:Bee-milk protein n=1 Tax=Cloeon dipterum TaxID=197152 RepID=A0A8S1E7U3_9INSE|nr:Hypothetical predicted protein [Cloeon dipterum]